MNDYRSHIGQDRWVAEVNAFANNRFFLDFGAFDGTTISNTYFLEKTLGWRGICVEPNPRYFPSLCESRSCVCINSALWPTSRELLELVDVHGLSSVLQYADQDGHAATRAGHPTVFVDSINPSELLDRFDCPTVIDYLSLDVEGCELDVLQSLDLKRYQILLMTVEHNHNIKMQRQLRDYLSEFEYDVISNKNDDFFFKRNAWFGDAARERAVSVEQSHPIREI